MERPDHSGHDEARFPDTIDIRIARRAKDNPLSGLPCQVARGNCDAEIRSQGDSEKDDGNSEQIKRNQTQDTRHKKSRPVNRLRFPAGQLVPEKESGNHKKSDTLLLPMWSNRYELGGAQTPNRTKPCQTVE